MAVLGRCSAGDSSPSSNLPLKLWTTHTTYNKHTHMFDTHWSSSRGHICVCKWISVADRDSWVIGWINRLTQVCRSHMCVLTFSWGCCSYDGCWCCMSSSNKEQDVAWNEITNFKLAEQRRDTEALRAESCAGRYSLRSSAGWELWTWLLKAFNCLLWSKEARKQKEWAKTHSAALQRSVRSSLRNVVTLFSHCHLMHCYSYFK